MTQQRKQRLKRLLQESRYRLYTRNATFAEPLYEMLFVATKDVWKISTNGSCVYFDPDWIQKLSHTALDFILSHQLMHIALGHIDRPQYYRGDRFHLACDIVANSHLEAFDWQYDQLPQIGRIYRETFFPVADGRDLTAEKALDGVPFDPAALKPAIRRQYMIDSEDWWDRKNDRGENGIVVLSPADKDPNDLTRDIDKPGKRRSRLKKERAPDEKKTQIESTPVKGSKENALGQWEHRASKELLNLRNTARKDHTAGIKEDFIERIWQRAHTSKMNWRQLLDQFLQEDVFDYSFTPPDRRLQDSLFFLPDYHVPEQPPKEVLFLVDTSGSVDENSLASVYSEICNALAQFNGGLVGTLACFDMRVYTPLHFSDITDLANLVPRGGGGTSFHCAFEYVAKHMAYNPPASIVVFTDGQAEFPSETAAENIPVLWLFSNENVTAPWGKYAYVLPNKRQNG